MFKRLMHYLFGFYSEDEVRILNDLVMKLHSEVESLSEDIVRKDKELLECKKGLSSLESDLKASVEANERNRIVIDQRSEERLVERKALMNRIAEFAKEIEIKDNFNNQNRQLVQDMQAKIDSLYAEHKDLIATNERLIAQIKDLGLCIMEKKDISGRAFSRIAPLVDEEGYQALVDGTGRMKLKLIHDDGTKQVVHIESA